MRPSRRTQPYRRGKARPAGQSLAAMLRGRPAHRPNPQDAKRKLRKRRASLRLAVRRSAQNRGR